MNISISNAIKWRNLNITVVCIIEKNIHALFIKGSSNFKQKQQDLLFPSFYTIKDSPLWLLFCVR